jgi:hypothetical protein
VKGMIAAKELIFLKIFSRTRRPISIEIDTNHPWVKGIQNCTKKGQVHFKGKIITKITRPEKFCGLFY